MKKQPCFLGALKVHPFYDEESIEHYAFTNLNAKPSFCFETITGNDIFVINADCTGCKDYIILAVLAFTPEEAETELSSQIDSGIFANISTVTKDIIESETCSNVYDYIFNIRRKRK